VLGREELLARVRDHVENEVPKDAIAHEGLMYQLLGVLPTDFDYAGATFSLLGSELAGFYEPSNGSMYLAADLPTNLAEATLAHELVHALQDQQWNLGERTKYVPGEGDRMGAYHALAEGDATSAMADVLVGSANPGQTALDLPESVITESMTQGMQTGAASSIPKLLQASLAAPYVEGFRFVQSLRRLGGWAAVDSAWKRPPVSSEQLLHLEKWQQNEKPVTVPPAPFATLGNGYESLEEDTMGELGLKLLYAEWASQAESLRAASRWGGDRLVLLGKGANTYALALRVRFDEPRRRDTKTLPAAESFAILTKALQANLGKASIEEKDSFWCIERPDRGPLAFALKENQLVILAGPTTTHEKGEWVSEGSCKLSKLWAREVTAAKRKT
jgi:hypothetical protein